MTAINYMLAMMRDDPTQTPAAMLAAFTQQIAELQSAVAGMTDEQVRARPIAGKWSTQEVVAHLADTEIYFTDRMLRTIALDHPLHIGVDERNYTARLYYQELVFQEQLEVFVALRRRTARILQLQADEAWQRTAVHSETGLVTLRQLVQQATRHTNHHLPFIAEKRRALTG
jgi:uncharacterized damage-inducible protein DinB